MLKKDKPKEVEKLVELIKNYSVIGMLNLHNMPARQLQKIKQVLGEKAKIRVSKKSLIKRVLEKIGKKGLEDKIINEPGLILTDMNPFKLYMFLEKNKSPAPAKEGNIAPNDIIVKKGTTDLPAGPAITTLQKVGIKTKVDAGKISVLSDCVVCKKGQAITADMVNVFNLLKMEPMEIGLDMVSALDSGVIYDKAILAVDEKDYTNKITAAVQDMFNLSVNIFYLTDLTTEPIIQKAFLEMKNLGTECWIVEQEVMDDLIIKAERGAVSLGNNLKY